MAVHDFLTYVLPGGPAEERDGAPLPPEELWRRAERAAAIAREVDLLRLTDEEREELSGPARLDEIELNMAFAALCEQVPEILDLLNKPRTLFGDALELDLALGQLEEATGRLVADARAGSLLLAAQLSEKNDRVEDAALRAQREGPEEERLVAEALFSGAERLRRERAGLEEERRLRRERRLLYAESLLGEAARRQRLLAAAHTLRDAALTGQVLAQAPMARRKRGQNQEKKRNRSENSGRTR